MTASSIPPGVIPYVDVHHGPRRYVTVSLEAPRTPLAGMTTSQIQPNLFVDGRQDGVRGASLLLEPGSEAVHLHYRVPVTGPSVFERVGQR